MSWSFGNSALSVWKHGEFARFTIGRFFATIGWQMMGVAVGWRVYELTHDALALGLVGLSQFLPFVSLVMVGGYVADHAERRSVLICAYLVEAVFIGVLVWLTAIGNRATWPIYMTVAALGATRAFWAPASQAILPRLVPLEQVPQAIAANSIMFQVAVISGPALGGLLFLLGAQLVFGLCAVLFLVTALLLLGVRRIPVTTVTDASQPGVRRRFLEGLRFVFSNRILLGCTSLDLFAVLFGGATALLPIFADQLLQVGPAGLGLLRTAPGVGATLMAAVLAFRPVQRHAGLWLLGGVGVFGCATVVFGLSRSLPLSLAVLTVLGAGDMLSVYVRNIVVQMQTPDAIRGRVSAVSAMFIGASNELGEFESGFTARLLGVVPAVVFGGCATVAVVLAWSRLFPGLRRLDQLR
ncbi:MAG: MFS transporter [Steroidobacteraceae bacterium]